MADSPEVPRGPLAATAKAVRQAFAPMVAWFNHDTGEVEGGGITPLFVDSRGTAWYAPPGRGRTATFRDLDDWRSRL
jgi:hypothetical protein